MRTPVVKVDKMTRDVVARYASLRECSNAEGIPATTIAESCRRGSLAKGRYYYRREADFDPFERFEGNHNCPLISRDVESGDVAWHVSLLAASEALGATRPALSNAANYGHVVNGRYRVAYCPVGIPKGAI